MIEFFRKPLRDCLDENIDESMSILLGEFFKKESD